MKGVHILAVVLCITYANVFGHWRGHGRGPPVGRIGGWGNGNGHLKTLDFKTSDTGTSNSIFIDLTGNGKGNGNGNGYGFGQFRPPGFGPPGLRPKINVNQLLCAFAGKLLNCEDTPEGAKAPLPIRCTATADIIIMIDASASIGLENFKLELSFATNLAASMNAGQGGIRFGLVVFSDKAVKQFDLLDNLGDAKALYEDILNTPYYAGGSATEDAFNLVINSHMFECQSGGRSEAPDIIILLTAGQSRNPSATAFAAQRLRNIGTKIFVVGIGASVNQQELFSVAGSRERVFLSGEFALLKNSLYQLVQRTCVAAGGVEVPVEVEESEPVKPPACIAVVDLIFVLDSSGSIGKDNYQKQLQFTTDLTSNFKIGPNDVQVGCVVFSHLAQKWFDLKDNPTYASLKLALKSTPYLNYTTHTDEALDLITNAGMFSKEAGARSNSQKLVIVITDGQSDKPAKTKAAAERLKAQGIETIAVGIGAAQESELRNIASSPQNVFKIDNFDALKKIESAVTQRACPDK